MEAAPGALTPLNLDFERMRQVLSNLVANALRYSSAGWHSSPQLPFRA